MTRCQVEQLPLMTKSAANIDAEPQLGQPPKNDHDPARLNTDRFGSALLTISSRLQLASPQVMDVKEAAKARIQVPSLRITTQPPWTQP
jgi:hypothetical protein